MAAIYGKQLGRLLWYSDENKYCSLLHIPSSYIGLTELIPKYIVKRTTLWHSLSVSVCIIIQTSILVFCFCIFSFLWLYPYICCLLYCDSFGLYSCMCLVCYLVLWLPDLINATLLHCGSAKFDIMPVMPPLFHSVSVLKYDQVTFW